SSNGDLGDGPQIRCQETEDTSSPPLSYVPNTQKEQVRGTSEERDSSPAPTRDAVAYSLYNCNSEEDYRNWIRWMVIPFAKAEGMSTNLGIE
ncbi:hypothetical protein FRX31_033261, partial [Thalictrum thalictroides]